MLTRIVGARLIDPATGIDQIADLFFRDQHIVAAPKNPQGSDHPQAADRTIDGRGCVLMAGAIDLHTHIGGGKVSLARMLLQDQLAAPAIADRRPADNPFLPAAAVTGNRYLDMGYTTCFEPAVIPCNARSAHAEMADVVGIDTGGFCLLGNDDVLLQMIADAVPQKVINDYVAWMVAATQCIAVKVVNPGGISAFKFDQRTLDVDTPHPQYGVTPANVIRVLCRAVHEIGLVHPLHVHCSNLGVPGNIHSTLATIEAADGFPIHLTHAQFHCYGDEGPYGMSSAAAQLVAALQKHRNVTIDVGQVMFGQTVTISADTMHQFENRRHARPRKSVLLDIECEAGCGVVPFRYRRRRFVNALQWAIGLELFLLIDDPTRVFLTTDHPNGGPFTTYPHLIRLLGDRSFRETALAEIHPEAAASSELAGVPREYTLSEIATMTRSAPADILGLTDRGRLSPGSLADLVLYREQPDLEKMFAQPQMVFRRGQLVRGPGAVDADQIAPVTVKAKLEFDPQTVLQFAARYDHAAMMAFERLRIDDEEMQTVIGSTPTLCDSRQRSS